MERGVRVIVLAMGLLLALFLFAAGAIVRRSSAKGGRADGMGVGLSLAGAAAAALFIVWFLKL